MSPDATDFLGKGGLANLGFAAMTETSPDFLRQQAQRLRWLAREINDDSARTELIKLAEEYETRAAVSPDDEAPKGAAGKLEAPDG